MAGQEILPSAPVSNRARKECWDKRTLEQASEVILHEGRLNVRAATAKLRLLQRTSEGGRRLAYRRVRYADQSMPSGAVNARLSEGTR